VVGPGPAARAYAGMSTSGSEVVLFGGAGSDGSALGDAWTFDGTRRSEVTVLDGPSARWGANQLGLGATSFVLGGWSGNAVNATSSGLTDAWSFAASEWTQASIVTPFTPGTEWVAVGAFGERAVALENTDSSTWIFDGSRWAPIAVASSPQPRANPAMGFLPPRPFSTSTTFGRRRALS
jgi:hypothetical protein